jgi:hypothetical protein
LLAARFEQRRAVCCADKSLVEAEWLGKRSGREYREQGRKDESHENAPDRK